MNIVLCEPQCRGFEHATFNASLLHAVQWAYPGSTIYFVAEPGHLDQVRQALQCNGVVGDVRWEAVAVPGRDLAGRRRLSAEHPWIRQVLARAKHLEAGLLLLCSITDTGLLVLKPSMLAQRFRIPTLAVVHANLNSLLQRRSLWPHRFFLSLRTALNLPSPPTLRMVALGGPIYATISQLKLRTMKNWVVLDCPYLWPEIAGPYAGEPIDRVRFGYLGVAMKGFELFSQLADDIVPAYPKAEFHLVGFLPHGGGYGRASRHIQGIGDQPLSLVEFHRRARTLTYAVGTRSPEYYRLIASATFIDALAFQKPGIYIRNPYLDDYFHLMGDIGYLCEDYNELREVVRGIMQDFPRDRYRQQVINILNGRAIFSTEQAALKLRSIVEGCHSQAGSDGSRTGAGIFGGRSS